MSAAQTATGEMSPPYPMAIQKGMAALHYPATQVPARGSHPDTELLRACAEFDALEREYIRICDGPDAIADDTACDAAGDRIIKKQKSVLKRMVKQRATTLDGHLARIRSLMLEDLEISSASLIAGGFHNQMLLGLLLRDLSEQAGISRR